MSDALGVSFDSHVNYDYLDDVDRRFDYYHQKLERIEFDLSYFNKITKGDLPNKTLNVALAGTGVGKTMFMTHMDPHMHCRLIKMFCISLWKWQRQKNCRKNRCKLT